MKLKLERNISISNSDLLRVNTEIEAQFGECVLVKRNLTANTFGGHKQIHRQGVSQLRIRRRLIRSNTINKNQTRLSAQEVTPSYEQIHHLWGSGLVSRIL